MSTFTVQKSGAQEAARLFAALSRVDDVFVPRLVISNTETIELNPTIAHMLREIVENFSHGKAVTVVSHEARLTTQEAADFIGISRPTLIKMLTEYSIPFETVGRHRKIAFGDVQKLAAGLRATSRAALDELQALAEATGEYENVGINPLID
jgi:excisionase family DNA binding protein